TFAFGLYKGHYTYPMVAQFSTGILAHFSISIYRLGNRLFYFICSDSFYRCKYKEKKADEEEN
ncbi:MAG: hypothetical protein E6483_10195, partial [Bacteroides stercoris]|nr:hypothetical protein [Bacteroides stercoris]MDU7623447.1 hypothetical protein [Bacteroides stercoris]